jgi:hypothetical protein
MQTSSYERETDCKVRLYGEYWGDCYIKVSESDPNFESAIERSGIGINSWKLLKKQSNDIQIFISENRISVEEGNGMFQVLLDDIKEIADAKTKARGQQLQALGQALQSAGTAPTYNNSMSPISNTSNLTYTLSEEYVQGTQKICVYQRLGKLKFVTHNNKFTICSMSKRYSD